MARAVLIRTYFEPAEQVALASLVNISIVDVANSPSIVCENDSSYQAGRDVRFRLDIESCLQLHLCANGLSSHHDRRSIDHRCRAHSPVLGVSQQ